jgi:hypothetical protein
MTLSALNASLSGASPHVELPRDLGGKSAGGARFAAIVNALAAEDLQTTGGSASTAAAASPQGQASSSVGAQRTYESPSIDGGTAGLEGLIYGALAWRSAATPGQGGPSQVGGEKAVEQDASESASTAANASPSGDGALRRASGRRSASVVETADDSTGAAPPPTAEKGADANLTLAGLLYGGLASSVAAASGQFVSPGAIVGAGSLASADQASGGRAVSTSAAAVEAEADFARAGALDLPLTIRTAANGDASLGVSAVQSRTYLGVDSAVRGGAGNSIWRSQAPSASDAAAAAESETTETLAAATSAAAPAPSAPSSLKRSTSGAANAAAAPTLTAAPAAQPSPSDAAPTSAAPTSAKPAETLAAAATGVAPTATEPPAAKRSTPAAAATATAPARVEPTGTLAAADPGASSTADDAPPEKRSTSHHQESPSASLADSSAAAAPAAADRSVSSAGANLALNAVATGAGPVSLDRLAARLATEANAMTSQTASSSSAPAAVPAGADAVKELQIELAPPDLGAVSVKMRMAQGQLSVVMEVAKPTTLKAIESERGAIADRLGLSAQSVEILMAKPDAANQTSAESDHARNQQPGSQENGQSDPNRPSQGNERQSSDRENAASQWSRQAAAQPTPSGRGFGDLVV